MNIIILGAGQVGSTVATELSREESNELTVIDINQQILSELQDRLDLRTICGNGSYPGLLEDAGADDAADDPFLEPPIGEQRDNNRPAKSVQNADHEFFSQNPRGIVFINLA